MPISKHYVHNFDTGCWLPEMCEYAVRSSRRKRNEASQGYDALFPVYYSSRLSISRHKRLSDARL